jgi:penicillin-binding protein 2
MPFCGSGRGATRAWNTGVTSKQTLNDRRSLPVRLAVIRYALVVIFAALAVCFWYLQVAQHQKYRAMADNNHQRTLSLRAPRGTLFDRDGRVLVRNRNAFNISLVREQTKDLVRTTTLLARVTGVAEDGFREIIARHAREPRYRPIVLIQDASDAQVAAVLARRVELPDVIVEQVPTREYPTHDLAAHLFGYVGEITEAQLVRPEFADLRMGAIVGQSGIEQIYNALLMGRDGARRVVVNSVGREIETLGERPPAEGQRVQLTIDYDLQKAAEDGFRASGFWGSAAIIDPRNGEILALVSLPAFDPNRFAGRIDRATWVSLNTDRLRPLQNRAIQGRYSPGSTFKIVVAVAALEEGVASPRFRVNCGGGGVFYGRFFKCHLSRGHGSVDMRTAMEKSCNTYFYTLGNMVGIDRLHKWATALGLGVKTGVDLPHEVEGIMPSSEWKRRRTGEKWYAGETISVAIGQGQVSVTPISQAVMMATVANGGTRHVPHLVKAVDNGTGWEPVPPPPPPSDINMAPEHVSALHDGLWMAVNAAGTGGRARIPGRNVAGKTGTAQVISIQGRQRAGATDRDLRDHGWFVFFAPHDHPEIAGVVFTEHSGGGYLSAPIARHVMETFFAKKEGRPLPEFPGTPPAPAPRVPAPAPAGPVAASVTTAEGPGLPAGGQPN